MAEKLTSVQCNEDTKKVFDQARAVFGSYPEVMKAAAEALAAVIENEETVDQKRARLRARLARVSNSDPSSTRVRPVSNPTAAAAS